MTLDQIREAVVQGWCSPNNSHKVMDTDLALAIIDEVKKLQAQAPSFTTGHCKNKAQPGGCQLHNLQCGYPECDRQAAQAQDAHAEVVASHIQNIRCVKPLECPKCHALWLFWPKEQSGFATDTLSVKSATHCNYCENARADQLIPLDRVKAAQAQAQGGNQPLAPSQATAEPVACRFCSDDRGYFEWYCTNCGRHDDTRDPPDYEKQCKDFAASEYKTKVEAQTTFDHMKSENGRLSALADKWNFEADELREDNKRLAGLLRQALEALELSAPIGKWRGQDEKYHSAIEAIKAVLK